MDYREASIQFAQGAIKAAVFLNSGATLAILSQLSSLPDGVKATVPVAMLFWLVGTVVGAFSWLIGFGTTRYVDKWLREKRDGFRVASNILQIAGAALVAAAIFAFFAGAWALVRAL